MSLPPLDPEERKAMEKKAMEYDLRRCAAVGSGGRMKRILQACPDFDFNSCFTDEGNMMHSACRFSNVALVSFLLSHPAVDVNALSREKFSPIGIACLYGRLEVVQILLKDPRVDINGPVVVVDIQKDYAGTRSSVLLAARSEYLRIVQRLVACGKPLRFTALEVAALARRPLGVRPDADALRELLEIYLVDPQRATHLARVALEMPHTLGAVLFAFVIFLADDLLLLKEVSSTTTDPATQRQHRALRFFSLTLHLPMELQMVICLRAFGSPGVILCTQDSEPAFRALARSLLSSPI